MSNFKFKGKLNQFLKIKQKLLIKLFYINWSVYCIYIHI